MAFRSVVPTLFLVLGVASEAASDVPDPTRSTCPPWIYVVGMVDGGARPDPFGEDTVVYRDFANNPVEGVLITVDLSACCDIELCSAVVNGATVDCSNKRVSGLTDADGRFVFTVIGAARDPGNRVPPDQYGGGGLNAVVIRANGGQGDVVLCTRTAACLDQNGAAGGSNGTTVADVANLFGLFGSYALGGPYRGRGDLNANGSITIGDVSAQFNHFGRLVTLGGVGCNAGFCSTPACP